MAPSILGDVNYLGMLVQAVYWIGWFLVAGLVSGIMFFIGYFISFPYKMTVWTVFGEPKKNVVALGKPKKNRVRWNKDRTGWVTMYPLFKGKEIKPFPPETIYPGRNIIAAEYDNKLTPITFRFDDVKGCFMQTVPYEVRQWQSLEHKKNAMEFADHTWWDDNKVFMVALATAAICLAMVAFTVWATYKFATPGVAKMDALTNAINNMVEIKGK